MIDDKEAERRLNWMFFDIGIIIIGMILMFPTSMILPAELGFACFFLGSTVAVISITEMVMLVYSVHTFMVDNPRRVVSLKLLDRLETVEQTHPKAKAGIIWVWAVCIIGIMVLAIAWFSLSWPAYEIIQAITSIYSFPAKATLTIDLLRNVIAWLPIIIVLGLLLWAFVNSGRKEETTYPY